MGIPRGSRGRKPLEKPPPIAPRALASLYHMMSVHEWFEGGVTG